MKESKNFLLLSLQDLLSRFGYENVPIDTTLSKLWVDEIEPAQFVIDVEKRYEISISDDILQEVATTCTLEEFADKILYIIK